MHYELCIVHCPYVLLSNIELANKRLSGWVVGVYNFHAFFLVGFSLDSRRMKIKITFLRKHLLYTQKNYYICKSYQSLQFLVNHNYTKLL